ncbi:tetratricopeptide repeat protein [Streptomyces coeruleorubidus]
MPTAPHPQSTDELYQALQENDRRPYGRTRTVTAEELVDAAEQFAEPVPLVHALLELQEAYTYGAEPRKSPVVFARLLTLFDEQPDVFDERLRHMLFWRFKWVAHALRQLPEVPLASLRQWLTEMRDRYEKAGLGLQPYYGQAYQLAAHVGEDTTLAYELWAARTRTRLSDCEACEICERALYHLTAGDDERALRTWEPVLAGKESCREEPTRSVSYALLPLLRTGRTDRARELHLAGYRGCRRNPSMAQEVGRHLEFCALTGNEARGLELLAENRSLFGEVDSPLDLLGFLTGVEVLLQRVELLGHGELPAAGFAGRTWTVAGLRAEVRGRADDLAARFDARNGTTAHTDRRRARLDRAPLLDALELTLRPRSLDDVAPAAPVAAPAARTAAAVAESVPELIARARALDEQGHPDTSACWARLRTLVAARDYTHPDDPAVGPLVRLRADLLADEASRAGDKDEFAVAAGLYEEAAGLYDDAGLPGQAALARASALLAAAEVPVEGADATEAKAAALTAAHASIVRLHEETPGLAPHLEARLLRMRATALGLRLQTSGSREHVAPVLAEVELLHAFATRHDVVGQVSGALLLRASTYALSGDLPAAVSEIDTLLDRLKAHGPAWHLPRTLGLRGRLQLGLQDAQAAHADLTEGLRLAADWPADAVDAARLHGDLAQACMFLGRPDEALRHLTRSAELDLRHGSRTDAFCTYSNAAQLSLDLGRVEDCIALLDSLLAEPDVTAGELDDRLVAQLRLTRARALHAGDDLKAATAEFVALAAESAGWDDDPGSHAMIAAETAVLLGESGEFGRAREAAEQALAAHALDPRYEQLSNCLRELARLQGQQQGPDGLADALAFLADAGRVADEARAAGYEARGRSLDSALAYEHGRVNAYAGAYEDALAALEKALALLGEPGADQDHAGEWAECVRLAGAVEGIYLERPAPALTRLDAAVARLTALGHTDETEPLTSLAARLRDEE